MLHNSPQRAQSTLMSKCIVHPGPLTGSISVPTSKSHTLRAILFASLANGKSIIRQPLISPDAESMIAACRAFGTQITDSSDTIEVHGLNGHLGSAHDVIHAGNSGITCRFIAAAAALSTFPVVITGDTSIRYQRPMQPLLNALSQMGVKAVSTKRDGFGPVIIQGPLIGGSAEIDGQDSQPVSALLIASAFSRDGITLRVRHPGEKPWVDLTLHWFDRLGIRYTNHRHEMYTVPGGQRISAFDYTIPGDFSSAAFPVVAALATGSEITIDNLDFGDIQGDKLLIDILKGMGARFDIDVQKKSLKIKTGNKLSGREIDLNGVIDAVSSLAVAAAFAEGETKLFNGRVARQKECDRLRCTALELRKMGAHVAELEDGLIIRGTSLRGSDALQSHHDHRMAMALTVAALGAEGSSCIHGVECVAKTFPGFFEAMKGLGAQLEVIP